jgi:hypothetical protein
MIYVVKAIIETEDKWRNNANKMQQTEAGWIDISWK